MASFHGIAGKVETEYTVKTICFSIGLTVFTLSLIFTTRKGGSPGFIIFLFMLGLPALIGLYRGFASIFREQFSACSFEEVFRVISMLLLLILLSIGEVGFFLVFIEELMLQLTCVGGRCAQGGIGLMMYLPIAWVSYALVCLANAGFIKFNFWPRPIKPNFFIIQNKNQ